MRTTTIPRMLQPVMQRFREDGAPHVRMRADDGLGNAVILYEAIRKLPGKTLMRGDFDRNGNPLVIFPERPKKSIVKPTALSPIKARNIDAERQDMAQFLRSIADAAQHLDNRDQRSLVAAAALNRQIRNTLDGKRDFHVTPLKEPLRTLANTYKRVQREKIISQYKALYRQQSTNRDQRLGRFCAAGRDTFTRLSEALKPPTSSRYDVSILMAVHEMKVLLKAYLMAKSLRSQSFADYLRSASVTPGVQLFAKRWIAISEPAHTSQRIPFDTESWAKELDTICPLILKMQRRQTRFDQSFGDRQNGLSQLIYPAPFNTNTPVMPSLPPLPQAVGQIGVLQSVGKTALMPTISIFQAAHPTANIESALEQSDASDGPVNQPVSTLQPVAGVAGQVRGISPTGTTLPATDSQLINDMRIMLEGPRDVRYQPVVTGLASDAQDISAEVASPPKTLYRVSKQEVRESFGLQSLSAIEPDPRSSLASVPSVSSTEIEPSTNSISAEPFRLYLDLSEDGEAGEDSSS